MQPQILLDFGCMGMVHPRLPGVYDVVAHPTNASTGGDRSRGARDQAEVTHFS